MRSSIACIRCRRSKVKCVNNGVGTTCRACENSGRDCQYPPPLTTTGVRPRESNSNEYGTSEGRPKPKKRAQPAASHEKDSLRPLFDALDPRVLTTNVWQELYDIFQIHYSADLPFLHPSTFLKPLRQGHVQQSSSLAPSTDGSPATRPPMSPEFLLAFLALTARFHPRLVTHHSPATLNRASNPLIASDYYAAAASERLSSIWNNEGNSQDIERIQALLMLGLHEWGMCRGARAWLLVGVAIRSAQAMGLQYELDLDDEPLSRALALDSDAEGDAQKPAAASNKDEADAFTHQEIRRRTFWSCYIMDRYLSSGKYRPQMLHAKELRIQLPASERSFLFGEKVRTLMLGEEEEGVAGRAEVQFLRRASVMLGNGGTPEPTMAPSPMTTTLQDSEDDMGPLETGGDEGLVSRYVRVLEIYGRIIKWSCAGGRRTEKYPPWDPRSEFYHLRRQCTDFRNSLPRQHTLTRQNTQAHISLKTSTPYMLVHTVYLLCQIMLHREYVPFIPIRCSRPEGPLDAPLFPPEKYNVPPGFWADSARDCFKSAREIMDLVRNCQEWGALVETPIVGFAIYNVAFVGVYCINFPRMDPDGYMCTQIAPGKEHEAEETKAGESKGFQAARKALEMIGQMRKKLNMADGWFSTINRMHRYFRRMKSDYRKNVAAMESSASDKEGSPVSTRHMSLREGGQGGGLDEFKVLERVLKEFGNLEDHDVEMTDLEQRQNPRPLDAVYDDSNSGSTVKSEEGDAKVAAPVEPARSDNGPWNAINAAPQPTVNGHSASLPALSSGQFRSYDYFNQPSYQQPQQQPSHQQPQQQQQQQSDTSQAIHFRPVFTQRASTGSEVAPSLTSPNSHSAATVSQSSPLEHQLPSYNSWPGQVPMQPASGSYSNGVSYPQQQPTPIPSAGAYSTPTPQPQQQAHDAAQQQQQQQMQGQPWNAVEKEAWLSRLDTRLGGDDFAAFADGGDMAEWAVMSANRGLGGGWLSIIWGDAGDARLLMNE